MLLIHKSFVSHLHFSQVVIAEFESISIGLKIVFETFTHNSKKHAPIANLQPIE